MYLTYHELQVDKLCRYWKPNFPYQQHQDHICQDFLCHFECSVLPVFYKLPLTALISNGPTIVKSLARVLIENTSSTSVLKKWTALPKFDHRRVIKLSCN